MSTNIFEVAKDLLRSVGIAVDAITVESNPFNMVDCVKIEGHINNETLSARNAASVQKPALMNALFNISNPHDGKKDKPPFSVKKILKNGDYMTVLWEDGTKTIVKRAPDEPESDYAAFTAALGIRVFGSNSALKRIVESAEVQGKKKKKKKEEPDKVTQAFDKVGESFCKSAVALFEEMAKIREAVDEQQKTDEWQDEIEKRQNDNRS